MTEATLWRVKFKVTTHDCAQPIDPITLSCGGWPRVKRVNAKAPQTHSRPREAARRGLQLLSLSLPAQQLPVAWRFTAIHRASPLVSSSRALRLRNRQRCNVSRPAQCMNE